MTVGELIERLKAYPAGMRVVMDEEGFYHFLDVTVSNARELSGEHVVVVGVEYLGKATCR
jgi:hypothetical protein